jgi:N-acyl homoserine lactone hydrolase
MTQFKLGAAIAATVFMGACTGYVTSTEAASPEAAASIELYTFDCGKIEISDRGIFANDGRYDGQASEVADSCFVVSHPKGNLLWDLGLPAGLIGAEPTQNGVFTPSLEVSLVDQIAAAGIKSIDYVAISHHHFDHTGQQEAAAGAKWLVPQAELDFIENAGPEAGIGDMSGLIGLERTAFTGDYDVFGDGSVVIISLPGHTAGHAGLLVNLAEAGPVMLTGDLYHFRESRTGKAVPAFNFDAPETLKSMKVFEDKVAALNARVIIQHAAADLADLPKPPEALK